MSRLVHLLATLLAVSTATPSFGMVGPIENSPPITTGLPAAVSADGASTTIATGPAFSDPDGDDLTYSASGLPAGLSIDPTTGAISGTLPSDASTTSPSAVTVTATDSQGASVSSVFTLTIANPAPTTTGIASQSGTDGAAVTVATGPSFSDPDGDTLTYSASGLPAGISIDPNTGTITGILAIDASASSPLSITVTATDSQGASVSSTFVLTVSNPAPTTTGLAAQSGTDGGPVIITTGGAFSDPDGDALTFSASGLPAGLSIDPGTGTISGTLAPDASAASPVSITVTATDAQGASVSSTFALTIVNPAPVAGGDMFTTPFNTALGDTVASNDSDADGDVLTYAALDQPAHGSVSVHTDGSFTYTPTTGYSGPDTFTYSVTDAQGASSTATVSITVTAPPNAAPATTGLAAQSSVDGASVVLATGSAFSDPDGDVLTYSVTGLPGGFSIAPASGMISGTLALDASASSPFTITVTATDPHGASVSSTFVLTVSNPAPVTTGIANQSEIDGAAVLVTTGGAFSDPDGDELAFSAVGLPAGLAIDAVTGGITGTLPKNASDASPVAITVTATDAQGASVSSTFTLTITNPGPITTGIPAQSGTDGTSVTIVTSGAFSDPDGDALTFSASGLPAGLAIDPTSGAIAGSLANDASATSPVSITVTATDAQGASASSTFDLTVANPAPIAGADAFTTPANTTLTGTVASNDSDPDNDTLTFARTTIPSHGAVTVETDGSFGYSPAAGYSGPDSFTYTVTDAQGSAATTTVSITVSPEPNDAPATTGIDDQHGIDSTSVLIATAQAFTDPNGDALSYSVFGLPIGLAIDPATGQISGTLAADASASSPVSITVTATDPESAAIASSFLLTIVNPTPTAGADSFTTAFNTALAGSVATNDADPDGDPLSFAALTDPTHGSLTMQPDGAFSYLPQEDFSGTDSFTYRVTDAQGAAATSTVSLTVAASPNAAPIAIDDTFSSPAAAITGSVALNDSDPDGDPLSFAASSQPASGSVQFSDDGSFTYTPAAGFYGTVSFTYTVTDSDEASATAIVSITVLAPPVNTLGTLPAVMDDSSVSLHGSDDTPALQIADADSVELTVTLSATHGWLAAPTLAGVTVVEGGGSTDQRLVLHGPLAALNNVLAALQYQRPAATCGADEITLTTTDEDHLEDSDVLTVSLGAILIAGKTNEYAFTPRSLASASIREFGVGPRETALFDSIVFDLAGAAPRLVSTPRMFAGGEARSTSVEAALTLTDDSITTLSVPVFIYSPFVQVITGPHLNPQTSLYEQTIQVINSTPVTLDAFQLVWESLPAGVTLYSTTGTTSSGEPAITSAAPLAAGGSATYVIEFASTNLLAFESPGITLRLVAGTASSVPTGSTRTVDRVISQGDRNYLEFTTIAGEIYWIQYRDTATGEWFTSTTPVTGSGSSIHWLDAGAPMTSGTPTASRQYRLIIPVASVVPLQITQQPVSATLSPGTPATLVVGAIGARALAYQWYHDDAAVAGATGPVLDLAAADASSEGDYRASVTDGRSIVWSTAARVSLAGVRPGRLANLSVRARVGSTPLITGFVFGGRTPHTIAARSIGPSLARFGVGSPVKDPRARLYLASSAIAENDDWAGDVLALEADEAFERVGAFTLAADSADAALLRTLTPGAYTLHTINSGEPGVALAELFETGASDGLLNISGRARVSSGDDALIAGFTNDGQKSVRVMIRAVGPALERFGVAGVLADPRLAVYRAGSSTPIAANDDWAASAETISRENLFSTVGAFPLPAGSRDAVLVLRLPPGIYTAVASGPDGASGEALVEVYLITF